MQFTFATVLFFLTFGLFVSASPVGTTDLVIKRDNADIIGVFTALKAKTDIILPQIDTLVASGSANQANVEPLINEITAALDSATASLAALETSSSRKRQSDDEVAALVAEIFTSLVTTLDGLLGSAITIPGLGGLLAGVDTSLNQVLKGLSILLQGVLNLVANLLTNVAALLRSLALGLSLGTLGL